MSSLVTFNLCKGNPGALQFMMLAYRGTLMFCAERGFARMRDNDIAAHINYERGRGIQYKAGDTDEIHSNI